MSDYVRVKAVRYKLDNPEQYFKDKDYKDTDDIAEYFIDFILDYEYGASGDFENVRELTEKEYNKYKEIFEKVIPNIKPGELRLVHYCYYNGADEPSVWNLEEI